MVHLTLAIADFMMILITSALWAAASVGGLILIGVAGLGTVLWLARKALLGRRD